MPANLPLTTMISQDSTFTYKNRVLESRLGDGYVQRVVDGTNSTRAEAEIVYSNLTTAEYTTLINVLNAVGSWDRLVYQSPLDAAPKNWVVSPEGVQVRAKSGDHYDVSFLLIQDF